MAKAFFNKPNPEEGNQPELVVYYEPETEGDRVTAWRQEELEKAGTDPLIAEIVASDHNVDLHQAIELKAQGCTDKLLLSILF